MSEDIRAKAQTTLKEVEEVTMALLPEPKGELIVIDQADPVEKAQIEEKIGELDMANTQSIIQFRLQGAGRVAGDFPGNALGCPQQGHRTGRRRAA